MRIQLRGTMPSLRRNFSRPVRKNLPRSTPSTLVMTTSSATARLIFTVRIIEITLLWVHTALHRLCISELVFILLFLPEKLAEAQRRFATLQNELQSSLDAQRESWANGRGLRKRKTVFALSQQERCKHRNIKDLQLAFSEFYLSLILLQNYQVDVHKSHVSSTHANKATWLYYTVSSLKSSLLSQKSKYHCHYYYCIKNTEYHIQEIIWLSCLLSVDEPIRILTIKIHFGI